MYTLMTEPFWFDDFSILYKNYINFFPKINTTRIEQLNAIARFSVYLFILLLCFGNYDRNNITWLYLPIFLLFSTIFLYKTSNLTADTTLVLDKNGDLVKDEDILQGVDILTKPNKDGPVDYIDATGVESCQRPTDDNPFMNVLLSDYETNPTKKPACNYDYVIEDGLTIADDARNRFNKTLFRNVDDTFEKKNSQRTYLSTPSTTIPNNQTKFARWCYGIPETCKEKQANCLRYENVRYGKRNQSYKYVI